ncbi:MAG: hypothetical protein J5545_12760 [Bacteroidaceae bacterium]|nr:hypothetical protein [Bacteroidaceae bacterium]
MEKHKELTDELKDYILDPSKDYRQTLTMWRVDKDGNLVWVKTKNGTNKSYYIIVKEELTNDDWLTHMRCKMDADEFGEFACAYFKACEKAGIKELKITLRGEFDRSFKFADEE